jgi:alpha-tubulin suppressor-like RCC1 family protein
MSKSDFNIISLGGMAANRLKIIAQASVIGLLGLGYVPDASAATALALTSGYVHQCALTTAGAVMCWGQNNGGQLGDGTAITRTVPVGVVGLTSGVRAIAAGATHSCALMTGGTVKCWGINSSGELGNGMTTTSYTPVNVSDLTDAVAISVGASHACAVTVTGGVKCWGGNGSYMLGDGTATNKSKPISVPGVSGVVGIATGQSHTCALTNVGGVKCWGANSYGQLGNGSTQSATTRVDVLGLSDAVAITAGQHHNCVKTTSGGMKCWGLNNSGQLGNGGGVNQLSPVAVTGLSSGVASITNSSFRNANCVVMTSGEAKCWGVNTSGELGNGNKINQATPVTVIGLAGSVIAITDSQNTTCALLSSGIQCFGANGGQWGNGSTIQYPFPGDVTGFSGSAPVAPLPISPVTSNTPIYTWRASPGATAYRLNVNGVITTYTAAQVGCDGAFGLCTITGTSLTAGSYTWSVQGFNSFGDGPWSAGTTFRL